MNLDTNQIIAPHAGDRGKRCESNPDISAYQIEHCRNLRDDHRVIQMDIAGDRRDIENPTSLRIWWHGYQRDASQIAEVDRAIRHACQGMVTMQGQGEGLVPQPAGINGVRYVLNVV